MKMIIMEDTLVLVYRENPTIAQQILNSYIKKSINNITYYIHHA